MPQSESAAKAGMPANPEAASQRTDVVCFVVQRGRTRHPQRPLTGHRFLIGSGSNCQLQLGGTEIPMLHSVVVREDEGLWIEALVPAPQLSINGVNTRAGRIGVGDVIAIGPFEFGIQFASVVGDPRHNTSDEPDDEAPVTAKSPEEMSAAELVDAVGQDLAEIGKWEEDRRTAAAALREAARQSDGPESQRVVPTSIPVVGATAAPSGAAGQSDVSRRAAALLAAQHELADMLQRLSDQLRQLDDPHEDRELRVSA